jgi:hypothetical protein
MKAEHSRRIASRELADEFTGLIAELETDRTRAMLNACSTGNKYLSAHDDAFTAYAGAEWAQAVNAVPVTLIRAFLLRIRALEMKGKRPAVRGHWRAARCAEPSGQPVSLRYEAGAGVVRDGHAPAADYVRSPRRE